MPLTRSRASNASSKWLPAPAPLLVLFALVLGNTNPLPVRAPRALGPASSQALAPTSASADREWATRGDALMRRWAPLFVQQVSSEHPERDRPLPVNFDGDWDARNNWRHLGPRALEQAPAVYGSAILSETHAYLTYTLFYPRDWVSLVCLPYVCHDNDLEIALVVVERDRERPLADGKLVLVETKAHLDYVGVSAWAVERAADGRPVIQVESEGHGMYPLRRGRTPSGARRSFVPSAASASAARTYGEAEAYAILPLYETLWSRRAPSSERDALWTEGESGWLSYAGARSGRRGAVLGASMASSEYPGGVRPPWALRSLGERGDWFLDPELVAQLRYPELFPATLASAPAYAFNPYLDELTSECAGPLCAGSKGVAAASALSSSSTRLATGLLLVLLLAPWLRWRYRPVAREPRP